MRQAKPNTKLRFAIRDNKQFDLKNNPGCDFDAEMDTIVEEPLIKS